MNISSTTTPQPSNPALTIGLTTVTVIPTVLAAGILTSILILVMVRKHKIKRAAKRRARGKVLTDIVVYSVIYCMYMCMYVHTWLILPASLKALQSNELNWLIAVHVLYIVTIYATLCI